MTDDIVARLREAHQTSQQRIVGSNIFAEAADEIERLRQAAKGQLVVVNAAEARVRELEAELAAMEARAVAADLAVVKAARVATAETIERCAKVADEHRAHVPNHDPEMQSDDLVAQGYGNAAFNIAVAIRKLAQEERHAKAD